MGEAKRRRELLGEAATALGQALADRGKLVEAGWAVFADAVLPPGAPIAQTEAMRLAFMAGAEHVFSTMIDIMDPGEEPTAADMRRMDMIHRELDEWRGRISERVQSSPEQDWEASGKRLGDAPVEAQYHADMTAIVRFLDARLNGHAGGPDRHTGFVLMVFPFDEVGPQGQHRCNYMSNGADRRDIVVLMKELIRRFEGEAAAKPGRA